MSIRAATEADIQRVILHYLALRGVWATRINSGSIRDKTGRPVRFNNSPGCADILACCKGRYIAFEVKRPGKKATDIQNAFLAGVRKAGGVAEVVTSVGDVEQILNEIDEAAGA